MAIYERHDWLAGRIETAIDPKQVIIDPHHHLWERDDSTYLARELLADTRGSHNVTHTVFVECSAEYDDDASTSMAPVGETRFVAAQAHHAQSIGGTSLAAIVAHADLMAGPAVRDVLGAHEEAGAGLFRGIRHGVNWSRHADVKNGHHGPAQGQLADGDFRAGIRTLADMGYSFDAWLYFDQLSELADLARVVPECVIVVNHLGGPLGIGPHAQHRAEMADVWRAGIADIATCPNAVLKVGGIGMEHYFGTSWASRPAPPSSEEVAVYWHDMVHFAIDAFGPHRCMFESNYPVDRQTLPYPVLWNSFQILAADFTAAEQHDLFSGTATRTYQIAI